MHGTGNSLIAVGGDSGNAPYACYLSDFTIHPFNIISGQQDDMSAGHKEDSLKGVYAASTDKVFAAGDWLGTQEVIYNGTALTGRL